MERLKERLKNAYQVYGPVLIGVFATLWVLSAVGLYLALRLGWQPQSVAGKGASFAAVYVLMRVTFPVRVGATLVLTPLVAKLLAWMGLRKRV